MQGQPTEPSEEATAQQIALHNAVQAAGIMFQVFGGSSYIAVFDAEGYFIAAHDVAELPFGFKSGDRVPQGTATFEAIASGKRISRTIPAAKSAFGFSYAAISQPFFAADGSVAGAIAVTSTMHQQDEVQQVSEDMLTLLKRAGEAEGGIAGIADQVKTTVAALSSIVAEVREDVGVITDVLGLIRNVADQTNLLGLNASIEAARAGQAGLGFRVVAHEIRKLSEKVKASIADLNVKLSGLDTVISRIDPEIGSLNAHTGAQARSIEAIHEITSQLQLSVQRLDGVAQEFWVA